MNMIFNLIIKIFEALFEEDTNRRVQQKGQQGRPRPVAPPAGQGQQGRPAPAPKLSLEQWLENIVAEQTGQPAPHQPIQQKAPPPVLIAQRETYAEHMISNANRLKAVEKHVHDDFGDEDVSYQEEKAPEAFKLPGRTPLEQMIYANMILGPCKAKAPKHHII